MEYVIIGEIINTFGIRGELKIDSHTDFINDRYKKDSIIYIGEEYKEYVCENVRVHKGFIILKLKGFDNINNVLDLKGKMIYKNVDDIKSLKDGEYYFKDLKGLDVFVDNKKVGIILKVEKGISYNFLRIKKDDEEILVPYLKNFILNVDIANNRIDVVKMDGLLWK